MSDWTKISRNLNKHGDFVGRSEAEQDAYYAFFAGPTHEPFNAAVNAQAKALKQLRRITGNSLRWMFIGLSFPKANNR